jgi:hypothetical protein
MLFLRGLDGLFPTSVLQRLQQLTYLELAHIDVKGRDDEHHDLQPLQALTRLVDLRLQRLVGENTSITASMLSGTPSLTRLELPETAAGVVFDAAVLDGKDQLQHLHMCNVAIDADAELLTLLQHLHQLTHLCLSHCLTGAGGTPPTAAYAALTASSKLRHLDISGCTLPAGAWQHVFPAGRQLPHLQYLGMSWITLPCGSWAAAPDGSSLVRCCPSIQAIRMEGLEGSLELLGALKQLSGLHTLHLDYEEEEEEDGFDAAECMQAVCQLTGLRELSVVVPYGTGDGPLLQLTQLKRLTTLSYQGLLSAARNKVHLTCKVGLALSSWCSVCLPFMHGASCKDLTGQQHPALCTFCLPYQGNAIAKAWTTKPDADTQFVCWLCSFSCCLSEQAFGTIAAEWSHQIPCQSVL